MLLFSKEYQVSFENSVYLYWGRWSKITGGKIKDNFNPTAKQASKLLKWMGENLDPVEFKLKRGT